MNITHWIKKEDSGLMRTSLEFCHFEERMGHNVCVREPSGNGESLYGDIIPPDIHVVHSQFKPQFYHDDVPKVMVMHGEPLSSVANGISMKAIVDLAPLMDSFICMRPEEQSIWNMIRRTFVVNKGVDLDRYKPLDGTEKLSGAPSVVYCENWRGQRNPLYLVAAMRIVHNKIPGARLHLYNCNDPRMHKTFKAMHDHCKLGTFLRSMMGPVDNVVHLYNQADIVVSCLHPLYARTPVESLACGTPIVSPGYSVDGYPFQCDFTPESMADAIIRAWEDKQFNARQWAEEHHSAEKMVGQAVKIYEKMI